MQENPIDPSLAYTALLELDPEFGKRTVAEGAARRAKLLTAYYAQDTVRNLWDFTPQWLATPAGMTDEALARRAGELIGGGGPAGEEMAAILAEFSRRHPELRP
jgi:hypothetical protein